MGTRILFQWNYSHVIYRMFVPRNQTFIERCCPCDRYTCVQCCQAATDYCDVSLGAMGSCWYKCHGSLTRYLKLRVVHAPEMLGMFLPQHRLQRKPLVSDPGMHHGTCVTHVPWCMSGSLTRGGGKNIPGIPGACSTINFAYLVRGID